MIEFIEARNADKCITLKLLMNSFLLNIVLLLKKEKPVYVVYPVKDDLENYALDLETLLSNEYKVKVSNITYIDSSKMLEELPTFLDNVVVDPRVCFNTIDYLLTKLQKIKEISSDV